MASESDVIAIRGRLQFIPEAEGATPIELGTIEIPIDVRFGQKPLPQPAVR